MPGPFGCCGKRGAVDVVPVEPAGQPQQNGLPGLAGAAADIGTSGAASSQDGNAGRRASGEASSSGGVRKSVTIDGSEAVPHADYFDVRIQTGSGTQFSLSVHDALKVNDVHKMIAKRLGEFDCPASAIRLIRGAKVMSHRAEEPISAFEVSPGDLLQMVVVRDGAAPKVVAPPVQPPPTQERTTSIFGARRSSIARHSVQAGAPAASRMAPPPVAPHNHYSSS